MPEKNQNRKALRRALPKLKVSRVHGYVAPVGVIQQQRIDHAIAHSARILLALQKPDIPAASRAALENALEDYKDLIHQAGSASVAEAHETLVALTPSDLTHDQVRAARAHLEG
jgi:hypothetical protein